MSAGDQRSAGEDGRELHSGGAHLAMREQRYDPRAKHGETRTPPMTPFVSGKQYSSSDRRRCEKE